MSDQLDHILSESDEIIPSSGFAASVMEAVQREAAAPPPIPFPWKRALPGLAVAAFAFISLLVGAVETFSSGTTTAPATREVSTHWVTFFGTSKGLDASWIAVALVLSFVAVKMSTHFAERKS